MENKRNVYKRYLKQKKEPIFHLSFHETAEFISDENGIIDIGLLCDNLNRLIYMEQPICNSNENTLKKDLVNELIITLDWLSENPDRCTVKNLDFFKIALKDRGFDEPEYTRTIIVKKNEKLFSTLTLGIKGIKKFLELASSDDVTISSRYACYNFLDIYWATLYGIFENGRIIKKCQHCGRYFVPQNKTDEIYCRRKSNKKGQVYEGKTCSEAAKYEKQLEREKNKPRQELYHKISARLNGRIGTADRLKSDEAYDDYEKFKADFKNKKQEIAKGEYTEGEFIKWLKKTDEETKKGDSRHGKR